MAVARPSGRNVYVVVAPSGRVCSVMRPKASVENVVVLPRGSVREAMCPAPF